MPVDRPKPKDLAKTGLLDTISMAKYTVDSEKVDKATGIDQLISARQGGSGDLSTSQPMHPAGQQPPGGRGPIPGWVNPFQ